MDSTDDICPAESIRMLDAIPLDTLLQQGTTMVAGPLTMHFPAGYVSRSDLVTALLIHDNIDKRPIFFALSAANFPEANLGLAGHMVTQGLVRKVMADSVKVNSQIATRSIWAWSISRVRRRSCSAPTTSIQ